MPESGDRPPTENLRANTRAATKIYQSFTAGLNRSDADNSLFTGGGLAGTGTFKKNKKDKDDEKISEDEKQRILRVIEQEEDSSDESSDTSSSASEAQNESESQAERRRNSKGAQAREAVKLGSIAAQDDSFSDNDILNRSLESASESAEAAAATVANNPENFLRYVSDKYNASLDILQIVDKNERSFK